MGYTSGAYKITGKVGGGQAVDIGGTEDGITVMESPQVQDINNDEWGSVPVDGVDLGVISRVRFTYIDYAAVKALMYAGRTQGDPKGKVGTLISATAIEIVATPVVGTPAAVEGGTWTFYAAKIDGDFEILLGSRHRKGPLTFKLLPAPSGANAGKLYTPAAPAGGGA